jgi:hypothetical protein
LQIAENQTRRIAIAKCDGGEDGNADQSDWQHWNATRRVSAWRRGITLSELTSKHVASKHSPTSSILRHEFRPRLCETINALKFKFNAVPKFVLQIFKERFPTEFKLKWENSVLHWFGEKTEECSEARLQNSAKPVHYGISESSEG